MVPPTSRVMCGSVWAPEALVKRQSVKAAKDASTPRSPAVTVAVAKQRGLNAVTVTREVLRTVDELKGTIIPTDVRVSITRDYGETADEKANELLWHLLIAVAAVVLFLGLTLGVRPAMVVSLAIPVTLSLTLFTSMLIGYTINRVTLFALIFSIGILVDDAIVVVENTYRHLTLRRRPHREASIYAVDEVGNPTILATFTVIAALLPMAFISGLMGPYMRPIPVNASIAMFFSLLVAFVVIPWFCQTCYREGVVMKGAEHDDATGRLDLPVLSTGTHTAAQASLAGLYVPRRGSAAAVRVGGAVLYAGA